MAQEASPREVVIYADQDGNEPFTDWLNGLRDAKARSRIRMRLRRIEQGNYGDFKHVGDGVFELRLFFGPGYRVYFAEEKGRIVLLLTGGNKSTQDKDIKTAIEYWKEYQK